MTLESNSKVQGTRSGKPTSYKRAARANRPMVVTPRADEPTMQVVEETVQPITQVEVAETPVVTQETRRRKPGFFSSIGKTEQASEADPKAARLARAMHGKAASSTKEEAPRAQKAATSPAKASATPANPRPKLKMRYLYGMMIYVLVAEYVGGFTQKYMGDRGWDAKLFNLGPIPFLRSTLVFLAILVVLLIVLARLDMIPKSLMGLFGRSATTPAGTTVKTKGEAATFETKTPQPTMKQGVQGAHDDLYQEYRSNQRYFQKRDRKR